jgi:hypothetical protein
MRSQKRHVDVRMSVEQPDQLTPGEPGCPEHGDTDVGRVIDHDG